VGGVKKACNKALSKFSLLFRCADDSDDESAEEIDDVGTKHEGLAQTEANLGDFLAAARTENEKEIIGCLVDVTCTLTRLKVCATFVLCACVLL